MAVVPPLSSCQDVKNLLIHAGYEENAKQMAELIIQKTGSIGAKTALRLAERAAATASVIIENNDDSKTVAQAQLDSLSCILEDLQGDAATASTLCEVL